MSGFYYKKILLLMLMLLTIGCATPYKRSGFAGGYRDYKIKDNMYTVYFGGNGYTNAEKCNQYAMRRAAEVTLENGYTHFVILDSTYERNYSAVLIIPVSKPEITLTISCFKSDYPKEAIDAEKYLEDNVIKEPAK